MGKVKDLTWIVIDEIYIFLKKKIKRVYIHTALGFDAKNNPHYFYFLSHGKGYADTYAFSKQFPPPAQVFSDGNPIYPYVFGKKNIVGKGIKTNLVESVNSQYRQYCSMIKRKTKAYAKDFNNLNNYLAFITITKVMK